MGGEESLKKICEVSLIVYGEKWGATTIGIPTGVTQIEATSLPNCGTTEVFGLTENDQVLLISLPAATSGTSKSASVDGYDKLFIRCDTWNNCSGATIRFLK